MYPTYFGYVPTSEWATRRKQWNISLISRFSPTYLSFIVCVQAHVINNQITRFLGVDAYYPWKVFFWQHSSWRKVPAKYLRKPTVCKSWAASSQLSTITAILWATSSQLSTITAWVILWAKMQSFKILKSWDQRVNVSAHLQGKQH